MGPILLTLKMEPIGVPETPVRNYHYSLRNNQEDGSPYQLLVLLMMLIYRAVA